MSRATGNGADPAARAVAISNEGASRDESASCSAAAGCDDAASCSRAGSCSDAGGCNGAAIGSEAVINGGGASELAQALAALVPSLPEECARSLRILLEQNVALPSGRELRAARLGLLMDLVSEMRGQVPGLDDYQAARAKRATRARTANGATGETWPDGSSLIRSYGTWTRAVEAAMCLAAGLTVGLPARPGKPYKQQPYTALEILDGLLECRKALGYWPLPQELREYGRLRRQRARIAGGDDPRIPDHATVLKIFGSWERAITAARGRVDSSSRSDARGY